MSPVDPRVEALLNSAGLPSEVIAQQECSELLRAGREKTEMAGLYDAMNRGLQELVGERGSTSTYHITGEARALVDPQAREVIRKNWVASSRVVYESDLISGTGVS